MDRLKNCPQCTRIITTNEPFCSCGFDLNYGSLSPKSGKCIYCDYNGRLSKEHIFGKWLKIKFPNKTGTKTHILTRPEKIIPGSKIHKNLHASQKQPYDDVTFNVCEECNNGWMARLHTDAKKKIISLVENPQFQLTERDGFLISRWAIMVAINCQHFGRIVTPSPQQLKDLKDGQISEFCWEVGILKTAKKYPAEHRARALKIQYEDEEVKGANTFFCIEDISFHIVNAETKRSFDDLKLIFKESFSRSPYRKIWPTIERSKKIKTQNQTFEKLYKFQESFNL